MECLDAQRIISEALDGEQVAPATIREAKEHCAGCRECLAYVKSLAAARRAPVPEPPADLADRVMARVREEAEAMAAEEALAAAAAAAADALSPGSDQPVPTSAPVDVKSLWARLLRPENRRNVAIWAGAAAALLVFVGIVAVSGVNQILKAPGSADKAAVTSTDSRQNISAGAEPVPESAPSAGSPDSSTENYASTTTDAPAQKQVVAGGFVYRIVGPSTYARSNLTTGGTTSSSLESADPPKSLSYYVAPEKNKIVLDDGTGNLIVFELVTRSFAGRQFALRSGDITSYREWPTMPPPMQAPANPDGAPEYAPAGTSMGVQAYVKTGTTPEAGIAIGPGTPSTDPAGGNPNWTWWTPLQ